MVPALSIATHIKLALYSSPVIAALSITPIAIMGRYSMQKYLPSFGLSICLTLFLWAINIAIWQTGIRTSLKRHGLNLLISIMLSLLVSWLLFPFHRPESHFHEINFHFHLLFFFSVNMVIVILQDLLHNRRNNARMHLEMQELKLMNMEAMNLQLKQQIQPHFLFNSLSTLKSLMTAHPQDAEEYLVRLSDFLRSSLSTQVRNTLPLKDELDICVNYLEMQKIRFGESLQFSIDIGNVDQEALHLPAFTLQLLVENAIKHNVLTTKQPLVIAISLQRDMLTVSNNLQKKKTLSDGPGLGLANLQARYKMTSGHTIDIRQDHQTFSVSLKPLQYEDSDH